MTLVTLKKREAKQLAYRLASWNNSVAVIRVYDCNQQTYGFDFVHWNELPDRLSLADIKEAWEPVIGYELVNGKVKEFKFEKFYQGDRSIGQKVAA